MSSESFRIWNVPSFTFELLSAFLRVVGERVLLYFILSFFNLYNEQSVPGVSNYSAIHWQVERYWFCISCVHFPSSSLPFNVHDDFIGRESFFPRLGHFIQALFSFLLLSSSKGLVPLKGGETPKIHLADPSYLFSWHQQFKEWGVKKSGFKIILLNSWTLISFSRILG